MAKKTATSFEHVEPIGDRVLVRKDEPKRETRGGIALPDAAEIPTITGRIVTISAVVENDEELPLKQYDKILVPPQERDPGRPGARQPTVCRSGRRCRRCLPTIAEEVGSQRVVRIAR